MFKKRAIFAGAALASALFFLSGAATAAPYTISITNLAPGNGTFLTPLWFGFHDGTFDIFDEGSAAGGSLQALAEGGDVSGIWGDFMAASGTSVGGAIFGPGGGVILPGQTGSVTIDLDGSVETNRFFNFASMILPSNDAFIGNDDAIQIFDMMGDFIPLSLSIFGSQVWDAGTEQNDELFENTAGLPGGNGHVDQVMNPFVTAHAGFLPGGNILTAFPGADFGNGIYDVALITITRAVPEPGVLALFLVGVVGIGFASRRRMQVA